MQLEICGKSYPVAVPWDGRPLADPRGFPYVGFDTEFDPETKALALVCLSGPDRIALAVPEQLPAVVTAHRGCTFVMHNAACDWPLCHDLLPPAERAEWVQCVNEGRVKCTMLLDKLIRLATDRVGAHGAEDNDQPTPVPARKLSALAADLLGLSKEDADPYRMRFGEIIGKPLAEVEEGFLRYAATDPLLTLLVYMEQRRMAEMLMEEFTGASPRRRHYDIRPDAVKLFGLLSEDIQVKGALALHYVEKRGIGVDQKRLAETAARMGRTLKQLEDFFVDCHPDVLPPVYGPRCKVNTPGERPRTATGALSLRGVAEKLARIAVELKLPQVPQSDGKNGGISKSAKEWDRYKDRHPFLMAWCEYQANVKLLGFIDSIKGQDRIHPRYNDLVNTGRTSCYGPNLQQQPKGEWRKHFVPTPGYKLFIGDLAGAELCTFAAFCRAAYGVSVMAEQLSAGRNIHAYFAAKIMGLDPDEFLALAKTDPKTFAAKRQLAKPANFGLMGGMQADSFMAYAAGPAYKVTLTRSQALELIRQWEETFPEGKIHRGMRPEIKCLARNLGCAEHEVENWLAGKEGWYLYVAQRVVGGHTTGKGGKPYSPWFVSEIRQELAALCKRPYLSARMRRGEWQPALAHELFSRDVAILTGRINGSVGYNELRNYPFQGLAGDIKVGLWNLQAAGHRLVGFIHDEVLVEVKDEREGAEVAAIIERAMEHVAGHGVPFKVEWKLSDCWSK